MSEQLKVKEKRRVSVNGVRQNCYCVDTLTAEQTSRSVNPEKSYVSLERKNLNNGFVEELVVKDYPINSKSVTSYADGADYRNDPAQAIANAPKRVNLGDVTQVQEFIQSDPQNAVRVFRDVIAKLEKSGAKVPNNDTEQTVSTEEKGGVANG